MFTTCAYNAGGSPRNNRSVRFYLTHITLLGNVNNPRIRAMPPKKKGGKKKKGKKKDGEILFSLATACDVLTVTNPVPGCLQIMT